GPGVEPAGRRRHAGGRARGRRRGPPPGAGSRVLLTLAAFVAVLGILIFVHEAGHFVAAKLVGIQVLRFSLGFGRPILAWRRGERITTVNGDSVRTWGELQLKLANAHTPVELRVAGRPDSLVLHIADTDTAARFATALALSPYLAPVISTVTSGGAGAKAG